MQKRSNTSGFSSPCALCFAVMITNTFSVPASGQGLLFILCMLSWPTGCSRYPQIYCFVARGPLLKKASGRHVHLLSCDIVPDACPESGRSSVGQPNKSASDRYRSEIGLSPIGLQGMP